MTKKTAIQRKELERQRDELKRKLKLVEEDMEIIKTMSAKKFSPELYQPGEAFEERMKYQTDKEFLASARRHDEIQSEFEIMKFEEQHRYYRAELARITGELASRD